MATRTPEFRSVEDRLSLSVDTLNFHLDEIPVAFDGLIKRVKLGILYSRTWHTNTRELLYRNNIEVTLDSKFEEEPRQMGSAIMGFEEDGYDFLSVSASAGADSLLVAARAASKSGIMVTIPRRRGEQMLHGYIDEIEKANDQLEEGNKLHYLMADVNDLQTISSRGSFVIRATGICIPGLPEPPEVEQRMTPAEARERGAACVSIGNALTCLPHVEMKRGAELALESLAQAE